MGNRETTGRDGENELTMEPEPGVALGVPTTEDDPEDLTDWSGECRDEKVMDVPPGDNVAKRLEPGEYTEPEDAVPGVETPCEAFVLLLVPEYTDAVEGVRSVGVAEGMASFGGGDRVTVTSWPSSSCTCVSSVCCFSSKLSETSGPSPSPVKGRETSLPV